LPHKVYLDTSYIPTNSPFVIVSIPYFPDLTDYKSLSKAINANGQLQGHQLHVVCREEDETKANSFADSLVDTFGRAHIAVLPATNRGPVQLANEFFRSACRFMWNFKPTSPEEEPEPVLLYFDPTYRPIKPLWANTLQSSHYLFRKPVTGDFQLDDEGAQVPQGPLIISKDFVNKSGLIDSLGASQHWRLRLKWEFTKDFLSTNLIGKGQEAVLTKKKTT